MSKSWKPKPTDSYKIKIRVLKALLECPKTYGQIAEEIDCKIRDVQSALKDMDYRWTTQPVFLEHSESAKERKYRLTEDGQRRAEVFRDIVFFDWSDERFVKNLIKRDFDVLIKHLEQGDSSAPEALAEIGDPSAVDPVIRAMTTQTQRRLGVIPFVRALGHLGGDRAAMGLRNELKEAWDRNTRYEIITVLGKAGGEQAAEALIEQLKSCDVDSRVWAKSALHEMRVAVLQHLGSKAPSEASLLSKVILRVGACNINSLLKLARG